MNGKETAAVLFASVLLASCARPDPIDPLPEVDKKCKTDPSSENVSLSVELPTGTLIHLSVDNHFLQDGTLEVVEPGQVQQYGRNGEGGGFFISQEGDYFVTGNYFNKYLLKFEAAGDMTLLEVSRNCKVPENLPVNSLH